MVYGLFFIDGFPNCGICLAQAELLVGYRGRNLRFFIILKAVNIKNCFQRPLLIKISEDEMHLEVLMFTTRE